MSVLDETIARIETDVGIDGWGEGVAWGSNFVAAFARGVLAGPDELVPQLIGRDPTTGGRTTHATVLELERSSCST